MKTSSQHRLLVYFTLLLGLLSVGQLSGCGGGDSREYGSLTGMVTIDGKNPPSGTLMTFLNPDTGAASSTQIMNDGSYKVPRLVVGKYNVGFGSQDSSAPQATDPDQLMDQISSGQYKAPEIKTSIPENLRSPESSGVSVEIQLGENSQDFFL